MVEFTGKIWRTGTGFVVTIPSYLLTTGEFAHGETVRVELSKEEEGE